MAILEDEEELRLRATEFIEACGGVERTTETTRKGFCWRRGARRVFFFFAPAPTCLIASHSG